MTPVLPIKLCLRSSRPCTFTGMTLCLVTWTPAMVKNDFEKWLNMLYYGNYGAVKATRGMSHDYLGMRLDFSQKNTVTVDMRAYVVEIVG
jgi:hypothetical protein